MQISACTFHELKYEQKILTNSRRNIDSGGFQSVNTTDTFLGAPSSSRNDDVTPTVCLLVRERASII